MKFFICFTILVSLFFLNSCGTPADNAKSKAMSGSVDQIIARSGTTFRDKDRALKDAKNRLNTGGGLLGKKTQSVNSLFGGSSEDNVASIGLPINAILWKSSLEVIDFMPLSQADPFAGVIITDWYTSETNIQERCKVNIFIRGKELKSNNVNVNIFCQNLMNNQWVDVATKDEDDIKIENAILSKAKKIKLTIN